MPEEIAELLSRLTELSGDEIARLTELVGAEYDRLDGEDANTDTAAALVQVVEAMEAIQGEVAAREQKEAAAAQQVTELKARAKAARGEGETTEGDAPEGEGEGDEGDGAEGGDGEGEGTEGAPAEGQPAEAVAASGGNAAAMARGTGTTVPGAPARTPGTPRAINVSAPILAAGALVGQGVDPARPITDKFELGKAMSKLLKSMPRNGGARGRVIVASAAWDYPEDRVLGLDPIDNARKVEAVTGPQAIAASGGICSPVNVDYAIDSWATAERPLKAGLPSFQADRGGLTFTPPPDIGALAGATSIWTEAMDAGSPGNSDTKAKLTIACGSPTTVEVDAVPTILGFGNMQGRFQPELVAVNTDLAIAAAARVAELNMLTHIDANSTLVTSAQYVGAVRDTLATLDLVAAAYRYRHRIPRTTTLTVIFPDWAKDLFRADLARELATAGDTSLYVGDAQLQQYFTERGFDPIWMLDGRAAKGSGTTYPAQQFAAQSAGAITKWPNNGTLVQLVWNLFVQGTMQDIDGGTLDLGVVRDSTLDATNDYETFVEIFEAIAFRGVEALTVISNLMPNGGSAASVAESGYTFGN